MRILVMDDDHSVGEAIQALLAQHGDEVVLVEDGWHGIRAFESSVFDAVILDIFLPEIGGLEIIRRLRRQSPTLPIIAISGFPPRTVLGSEPDFLNIAAALGATYCLRKPFELQHLTTILDGGSPRAPAPAIPQQQLEQQRCP